MDELVEIIKRKGIVEIFFNSTAIVLNRLNSILKVLILNVRGYSINYSVIFRGNITIFQSKKNSIKISKGSVLGRGTRITAGGSGKILISENVLVDDFSFIMAQEKIEIGKNTAIAAFCFITDFNHEFGERNVSVLKQGYKTKPVFIGKDVWIGTHSVILPGVKIGDGSVIGAGSIVTSNIPADAIAVGNPAKVIKKIERKNGKS